MHGAGGRAGRVSAGGVRGTYSSVAGGGGGKGQTDGVGGLGRAGSKIWARRGLWDAGCVSQGCRFRWDPGLSLAASRPSRGRGVPRETSRESAALLAGVRGVCFGSRPSGACSVPSASPGHSQTSRGERASLRPAAFGTSLPFSALAGTPLFRELSGSLCPPCGHPSDFLLLVYVPSAPPASTP